MTPFRRCAACGRLLPRASFPRYETRRRGLPAHYKPTVAFGPRCFDCGARPPRTRDKLDEKFASLIPLDGVPCDLAIIADIVGCSRQLIINIEMQALRKLRFRHPHLAAWLEGDAR